MDDGDWLRTLGGAQSGREEGSFVLFFIRPSLEQAAMFQTCVWIPGNEGR